LNNQGTFTLNNQGTIGRSFLAFVAALFLGCSKNFGRNLLGLVVGYGPDSRWLDLDFHCHWCQRAGSQAMMAKSAPTAGMVMAFRDQQKWLNALLADRSPPVDAERPR